ncbi:hypothetical protein PINS_up019087 [Pythium insidiosum]|nr:hypothetical protein PINS_up019087 [Pythium insidiosum]
MRCRLARGCVAPTCQRYRWRRDHWSHRDERPTECLDTAGQRLSSRSTPRAHARLVSSLFNFASQVPSATRTPTNQPTNSSNMRIFAPTLAMALLHAMILSPLTAADNVEPEINGWYPCGISDVALSPSGPANSTSVDLDDLPFECAEVVVPLCHDGICESDRTIDIFVKRVRSTSETEEPAKKAVWLLEGGPGMSSSAWDPTMLKLHELLKGEADIYTMDHRGTGRSHLLHCDAAQAFTTASPGGTNIDFREVPSCIKDVLFQIDGQPSAFSITSAAKDVELLVKTFNQGQETHVYGASYGTYLTSRLMHLAPQEVKGYILDGVWSESIGSFANFSSHRDVPGKYFASLCEQNEACKAKYAYGLEQHGDLFSAWRATYDKLDAADPEENACVRFLKGDTERSPSDVLRIAFNTVAGASETSVRHFIPAIFKIVETCGESDMEALSTIFPVQPGQSVSAWLDELLKMPSTPFNALTAPSPLLSYLIKASEMWTYPSPSWDEEKKAVHDGVFGMEPPSEYAWYCLLNGDMNDPSCDALVAAGEEQGLQMDLKEIEPVKFVYERDEYYRKVATVPDHASVMVMNGKLDFQTIHTWAEDEYEKIVGRKMFVEFDYGPHVVANKPSTAGDTTDCGLRILASYVATGGDVEATDSTCLSEVPEISFDVEAEIAQRIEAKKTPTNGTVAAHRKSIRGHALRHADKHQTKKTDKHHHSKHTGNKTQGKKHPSKPHHKN